MRLCLAGTFPAEKIVKEYHPEYVLESFFYIRPWQIEEIPKWKMFLLDSGAFTFMHGIEASSKPVDWDGYLSRYIDFINRNNVQHFFELDVDSIVGYDAVKRMRARLEAETGKQSIPVWHRSRGLDEFKRLCRDYPYIGIGGFDDVEGDAVIVGSLLLGWKSGAAPGHGAIRVLGRRDDLEIA